jgi:ubiquinone/menaquinone biosynthesis C-methylase UbiE
MITRQRLVQFNRVGTSLLDIGCSQGNLTKEFTDRWGIPRVVGIDLMIDQLAIAKHRIEPVQASGEVMPFRACIFDHVTCLDVLDHVDNPPIVIRELVRVLQSEGEAVLTMPSAEDPVVVKKRLRKIKQKWGQGHIQYNRATIKRWLDQEPVKFVIRQPPGPIAALIGILWLIIRDARERAKLQLKLEALLLPLYYLSRILDGSRRYSQFGLSHVVYTTRR